MAAIKILSMLLIAIMVYLVITDTGKYIKKGNHLYACLGVFIIVFLVIMTRRIAML